MNHQLNQNAVSHDPAVNSQLPPEQRLTNLENDLLNMTDVLQKLVDQNDEFYLYVKNKKESEIASREFWDDVKKKILVSGIWATVVIIATACGFAFREWVTK